MKKEVIKNKVNPKTLEKYWTNLFLLDSLSNNFRLHILSVLRSQKQAITITELKAMMEKELGKKYDFTTFTHHIRILEQNGLIFCKKEERVRGRPVMIKINPNKFPIELKLGKSNHRIL